MKKILAIVVFFVLSFQVQGYCQSDNGVLTNAVTKLKELLNNHIIEKAYLHFDHQYPYYTAGDVVYFKAYVTMGETHNPSTISGALHVDLIGKNDTIMQSISLLLNKGTAWGDFTLPVAIQKGSYRIRAYTDWMRNEKQPYFDQYISVCGIKSVANFDEAAKNGIGSSVQFFPEGGNLVVDLHSKVAFKALGPDGSGMYLQGVVTDNENKEIAKIAASHLGMGEFDFTPEEGRTYKAKVTFADGTQRVVDLPAVEAKGITLAVNNDNPNKVSIEIKANRPYYKENLNKELNLIIYSGGAVRTVKTKLDNAVLGMDLPANTFRTGILQVTLLSETGEPLNERLVFIQSNDLLKLEVTANKTMFAKRENVFLNLNVKNKDGNPVNGSFSVSVIDESKILVDENSENSILPYFLLTSDLKGYIEKPNYYFANTNAETRQNLDILMLTQGYRRFVWKQLLHNDKADGAAAITPKIGIDIAGTLKTKAGMPIRDSKITLIAEAGGAVLTQQTDENGKFRFTNMIFETGTSFILKTQSSTGKNVVLTFDPPAPGPAVTALNTIDARYNVNADLLGTWKSNQNQSFLTERNWISNAVLKEDKAIKRVNVLNYRSSNLGGPGHADQVILGDEIKNAPTLSAALNGVARGVQFSAGIPFLPESTVIGNGAQSVEPMLIMVDGTNVGSGTNIDLFNPKDIEAVEILKGNNAGIYGVEGGAGVMVITTKQGSEKTEVTTKEMSPGIFSITPAGFYKAKEFYSPVYGNNQSVNSLPDTRTTVFWKPDVSTDASGNASFNFYNAGGTGTYRVVIEGMDVNGNLGRQVYKYKVE